MVVAEVVFHNCVVDSGAAAGERVLTAGEVASVVAVEAVFHNCATGSAVGAALGGG